MPERSLKLPLSGAEIIQAILQKVEWALRQDCYLNPDLAYSGFEGEIDVRINLDSSGVPVPVGAAAKESAGELTAKAVETSVNIEIPKVSPNQVRQETGQPLPVLTMQDGKPEIKRVSYQKPGTMQPKTAAEKIEENRRRMQELQSQLQEQP